MSARSIASCHAIYLSDVIFGAAVGSIAGRTVVHHPSDYWAVMAVSVAGGGVALLVSRIK
jgi:hypothetical protein